VWWPVVSQWYLLCVGPDLLHAMLLALVLLLLMLVWSPQGMPVCTHSIMYTDHLLPWIESEIPVTGQPNAWVY
jgi:hypothetical protein